LLYLEIKSYFIAENEVENPISKKVEINDIIRSTNIIIGLAIGIESRNKIMIKAAVETMNETLNLSIFF
jgi:hypothetical protein